MSAYLGGFVAGESRSKRTSGTGIRTTSKASKPELAAASATEPSHREAFVKEVVDQEENKYEDHLFHEDDGFLIQLLHLQNERDRRGRATSSSHTPIDLHTLRPGAAVSADGREDKSGIATTAAERFRGSISKELGSRDSSEGFDWNFWQNELAFSFVFFLGVLFGRTFFRGEDPGPQREVSSGWIEDRRGAEVFDPRPARRGGRGGRAPRNIAVRREGATVATAPEVDGARTREVHSD
mmetsp:Transcript_28459/g.72213  ORF Transcript_28459/g.72213 Transcript_28459/m.72213 type:complete len:239 (+) Transcript_28459:399-1115(+)